MSDPKPDDEPVFLDDAPQAASSAQTGDPAARPTGLTTVCVLAILLGGAGFLMACLGLVSNVFESQWQQSFAGMQPGPNNPQFEIQRDMQARLQAISGRYKWALIPLAVAKMFVEAALLVGALMAWGLKPRGWSWLHGALIAALVFEIIHTIPVLMLQRETQSVMSEMMTKTMATQRGGNAPPPGVENFMSAMMSAVGFMSMVFALVWLGAKIAFYALGVRYLRKREVVALFAVP
jgi:hypothetical protein